MINSTSSDVTRSQGLRLEGMEPTIIQAERIQGLDSLRFICALWVFFGHGAVPPLAQSLDRNSYFGLVAQGVYVNIWNGPAAVIVFFVISGFCIHYPYVVASKSIDLLSFYVRRFVRLLIPVVVAIPLSRVLGVPLSFFGNTILWSLLAELVYYMLYPGFRDMRRRFRSWKIIVLGSFVVGFIVISTNPRAGGYNSYGEALNWLVGLPCWLLGCLLAEAIQIQATFNITSRTLWKWRLAILFAAWLCSVLRYHTLIGLPWSLNIFALLATSWLFREINYRKIVAAPSLLEWAGTWSYSFYLIHPLAGVLCRTYLIHGGAWTQWCLLTGFVLLFCYIFYLLIEWPSHLLARTISRYVTPAVVITPMLK